MVSHPPLQQLRQTLLDQAENVGKRNHAAYLLRTLGGAESIEAIQAGLRLKPDSTLLRHELAYILGQMQDESACCTLEEVLADTADDVMVRHEAAEALGAIGASRSEDVLRRFTSDPAPEVAQTCEVRPPY
jgi:deoxyhypusine monooxygenase